MYITIWYGVIPQTTGQFIGTAALASNPVQTKSVDVTFERFVAQCRVAPEATRKYCESSHLLESCASCSILISIKVALCVSRCIVRTIADSD